MVDLLHSSNSFGMFHCPGDHSFLNKCRWHSLLSSKPRGIQGWYCSVWYLFFHDFLFKYIFLNLFLERGEGKERGRKTMISCFSQVPLAGTEPATQACALTRNWTGNLLVCGTVPNQLSHTGQGSHNFLKLFYLAEISSDKPETSEKKFRI